MASNIFTIIILDTVIGASSLRNNNIIQHNLRISLKIITMTI